MRREGIIDENIFDNPLFLIADEPIDTKMYKWEGYGITEVTDTFDGYGKTFKTKYELERAFSLTIPDMTFNQINRAVGAKMKTKLSKPNNNSILSNYMNSLNNV